MTNLTGILKQYEVIEGDIHWIELNSGLINRTYKIVAKDIRKSFILQRINTKVFPEYRKLMKNVVKVSDHINTKLNELKDLNYVNAAIYTTVDNTPYYTDDTNSIWRLSDYIENNEPDFKNKQEIAKEAGKILGTFHLLTKDLTEIEETIPDFHNIDKRWKKLLEVVGQKPPRYNETVDLYEKIHHYIFLINRFNEIKKSNALPKRVVHNDPKLSNILFKNNIAISLIDPDTIMPGYLPVDFGDAVRSLCNTSDENETDIEKVDFDFDLYKEFSNSYLSILKDDLHKAELDNLPVFPAIITLEQLIRFYTDYLEGDVYYQVDYPGQNLVRSRVQLKLLDKMYKKLSSITY